MASCLSLLHSLLDAPILVHICRPCAGGMERPRDDFKRTHSMRLATRDKLFGGLVSRLQARPLPYHLSPLCAEDADIALRHSAMQMHCKVRLPSSVPIC